MPKKPMAQVRTMVLNYGSAHRNQWLDDSQGDEDQPISPSLSEMPAGQFDAFFVDFTEYIRADNRMVQIIMTANGLRACTFWADLVSYIFNLQ